MKEVKKIHYIIVLSIVMLVLLSGCGKSENENEKLKEKVNTEISYMDSELISIANEINNITYNKYIVNTEENQNAQENEGKEDKQNDNSREETNNGQKSESHKESADSPQTIFSMKENNLLKNNAQIDWDNISSKVETLYTSWATICIDLKEIGVNEEQLKQFENCIDNVAVSVKNQDDKSTIENIIELYKLLPEFAKEYGEDNRRNVLQTKSNLLICYYFVNTEQWDKLNDGLTNLKMSFSNISSKKPEYKGKDSNIKNAGVIINQISNSIENKDKNVFFIKYKNLMQELNIISTN